MKNVTYRWNTFQLYDYRGVEEHLSPPNIEYRYY